MDNDAEHYCGDPLCAIQSYKDMLSCQLFFYYKKNTNFMHCRARFDRVSGCWSLLRDKLLSYLAKLPDRKYERYIPRDDCWTPFFVEVPFPYTGRGPLLLRPRGFHDSDCPQLHVPIALSYYEHQPSFPYGPIPRRYRFWDGILNVPIDAKYVAISTENLPTSSKTGTKGAISTGTKLKSSDTLASSNEHMDHNSSRTSINHSKVVSGSSLKDVILSEVTIVPLSLDITTTTTTTTSRTEVLIKVEELDDIELTPLVLVQEPDGTPIVTIYD